MAKKLAYEIISFIVGMALGIAFLPYLWRFLAIESQWINSNLFNSIIGGVIVFLLALLVKNRILNYIDELIQHASKQSLYVIFIKFLGLVLGLFIGVLISIPLYRTNLIIVDNILPASIMLVCAYFGYILTKDRGEEIKNLFHHNKQTLATLPQAKSEYKILDTNVIIDGRIYDIAKTGFLEGTLLIPQFVLYELQYIADSGEQLKRVRGRRGLDILNALQHEEGINVEMSDADFPEVSEVDTKLILLAQKVNGVIVTNDYNLNKVSEFQNIQVLNINSLANALKAVVIPGEKMLVTIVKEGTEREQGVAYLDDGTMIVVENGLYYMNQRIEVYVTSAIQTAAGRMVFAKPVDNKNREK